MYLLAPPLIAVMLDPAGYLDVDSLWLRSTRVLDGANRQVRKPVNVSKAPLSGWTFAITA